MGRSYGRKAIRQNGPTGHSKSASKGQERKVYMKHIKKVFALVLAFAMVLAMSATVFAAEGDVTVNMPEGKDNHTYEIYQIFTGTVDGTALQNLKYGVNAVGNTGSAVSQQDMTALKTIEAKTYADDQAKIEDLAGFVDLTGDPIATLDKTHTSVDVAPGYYIIKDTDGTLGDPDTYTLYMFKIIGGEEFNFKPKDSTTTSDKVIGENPDSTTQITDSDIGKSVPYVLSVTLPSNYADYKDFYLKFKDDMSKGLTLNADSVKIHYGEEDTDGTAITFTEGTSNYTGGHMYEYTVTDLKKVAAASELGAGDKVWISYTATVNNDAVVGQTGNPNTLTVDYSNNPNETGDGNINTTPPDTNIVLTFKTIFNKVDADNNPLTGADFKLYKKVGDNWVDVTELSSGDNNPSKTVSTSGSTFEFSGLGQGDYKLEETSTPTGYNPIAPIEFTITAQYTIEADAATISTLTGTGEGITFTSNTSAGSLTADIVNQSGAELPETGGIGTIIFYVLGSLLVVGCGIVLISRKRMQNR